MNLEDLNSIIRLAGIKRNISEDGMPTPGYDGSGNRLKTGPEVKPTPLTSTDGKPVGTSTPGLNVNEPQPAATPGLGNAPAPAKPDAVGSNKPEVAPAKVSTQAVNSPKIDIQTINPAGQQSGAAPEAGTSRVDPDVQAQVNRLRAEYNNSSGTVAPEPAPAATLPPGVNPENGIQQYTPVDYSKDKLKEPPGAAKKKVLAPVDPDLQAVQKVLSGIDPKYKELLGPYGADGRIGKYTRNALAQYIKDVPSAKEHDVLKPILTKYGIIASGPTPASGASGESTPSTFSQDAAERKAAMKNAAAAASTAPSTAPSGPAVSPIPTSALPPGPSGAIVPGSLTPGLGNAPAPAKPAAATPATTPAAAPTTPATGGSAKEVRQRIQSLADKYKVSESRLTPVGQIQKFRQLVDEAEAEAIAAEKKAKATPSTPAKSAAVTTPASTTNPPTTTEPKLGNVEPVAGKPELKLGNVEPVAGKPEPKLGNVEPVGTPPPKAGTPVPGTPGYEFTGEVDAKGRPKARKIIVPPAAIEAEVTAAQQAGKLGLKQALPRVLGMTTRAVSFALGWRVAAAYAAMEAISWMYDWAAENGGRVNISREDMVQLGKDKQALETLASNKNLTPEEQKDVAASMEQMARLLANSESIESAWAKVGIPGRSGAPKQ